MKEKRRVIKKKSLSKILKKSSRIKTKRCLGGLCKFETVLHEVVGLVIGRILIALLLIPRLIRTLNRKKTKIRVSETRRNLKLLEGCHYYLIHHRYFGSSMTRNWSYYWNPSKGESVGREREARVRDSVTQNEDKNFFLSWMLYTWSLFPWLLIPFSSPPMAEPHWFRAAATIAGFIGRALRLRPTPKSKRE